MATPGEKLANSLEELKRLQENSHAAIKASELGRIHRERLVKNGFLKEATRGWYICTNPREHPGDSTSWFTSYWQFCSRYLEDKYGDNYSISAEQSLMIHAGNNSIPTQLIVRSPDATNYKTDLPYGTSIFAMKSAVPNRVQSIIKNGIRIMSLPASLIHSSEIIFRDRTVEARTALAQIKDSSEILEPLLEGGHSIVAGRLAGAFRNNGQERISEEILETMKAAGYVVRETDPFNSRPSVKIPLRQPSPYITRIRLMWSEMRQTVLEIFPAAHGIPKDHEGYMKEVEDIYVVDAYHSLSIEKYVVSVELIERVRSGKWDIKANEDDGKQRDAMAARGYWQAAQQVMNSIKKVLEGLNPGSVADEDHGRWYRELFGPGVESGILKASDLAGYRSGQVYIGKSQHVPLNPDAVRDTMPVLFELLRDESSPAVRAVLGHFLFVYIHPYMDGNGRMGRFLMNVMLASGGYPWTVIPVEERDTYMKSLEQASVELNIEPFAKFMAYLVGESLKGTPVAKLQGEVRKFGA